MVLVGHAGLLGKLGRKAAVVRREEVHIAAGMENAQRVPREVRAVQQGAGADGRWVGGVFAEDAVLPYLAQRRKIRAARDGPGAVQKLFQIERRREDAAGPESRRGGEGRVERPKAAHGLARHRDVFPGKIHMEHLPRQRGQLLGQIGLVGQAVGHVHGKAEIDVGHQNDEVAAFRVPLQRGVARPGIVGAATTWSEYKKYFEKDAALSRRFQLVKVSEPNAAEATIILRGLSAVYEQSHGVLIDDDALQAAATLSERYLSGRQLPDKAIDVLDTACARVAINLSSPPKQISALTTLSHQQEAEIRQLERELRIGLRTDTSRMTEVLVQYDETLTALDELEAAWHQQQTLVREIIALRQQLLGVAEDDAAPLPDADTVEDTQPESESEQDNTGAVPADEADREQPEETAETVSPVQRLAHLTAELDALHNDRLLVSPHVDKKQIAAVIAEWTGVPLNRLSQNEMSVITDLTKWLGDTIKGQDLAIASLHKHLLTARADLRRPGRPLGAFLLAGPSGVGKTETVLQLAELLYGGRQYLTTINMSEF